MSYNGSGTFNINSSGQPVVGGTTITSTAFNALTADVATGLSTAICKDGQTTVTANIPMASHKFTGLSDGSARSDSANIGNVVDGTGVYVGTVGGTADVITLTPNPAITAYTAGQTFRFLASGANTTNVTVNVSSLGAKAITKNGTTALAAGDIPSGMMVQITYDGTRFILGTTGTQYLPITGGTLTGDTTISVSDARTNSVDVPLTITSQTSDTPAAGIGTGILLRAESADEAPSDFGQIEAAAADVTAGSEDTYFQFLTRVAGAALTATYRWIATAANKAIFTHANSADRTYTLPDATGSIPTIATQAEVNAMTSTATSLTPNHNTLILDTTPTTTSTSFAFTNIPAGVRRATVMFAGISLSGADDILVQIGYSVGIENTGYTSTCARMNNTPSVFTASSTEGFIVKSDAGTFTTNGALVLTLADNATNQWVAHGTYSLSTGTLGFTGGEKTISGGALNRITIITTGTNTFDAGTITCAYER